MSDLDVRLRAVASDFPEPDAAAGAAARTAMHAALDTAPWRTDRRRRFSWRRSRPFLLATAGVLVLAAGALAAGGWDIGDLPPFGKDDQAAFVLPTTDVLPGGYERTRPPRYADLPTRPALLFPSGVGYTNALSEYAAAREAGKVLPAGVELTDPLPAGKVVMVRADGRVALDPAAPFGWSATTGLVTALAVPFDGRAVRIARCQVLIGATDPASPACDAPGVRRTYVREGVAGRWVPAPNEEAVFDRLTNASTQLSVIDHPTTPTVRLSPSIAALARAETLSGPEKPLIGRLALDRRDLRLIVAPVAPDRLCFIDQVPGKGAGALCGPRSNFLTRGAVLSGGRWADGPLRIDGLVGDGITRVRTNDDITAPVRNNVFTLLPGEATRVLTFTGPVGSFRVAYPRVDRKRRVVPDRSKERELLGVDLADGGHASIRVAPNNLGGRCDWVYVDGNRRSFGCFGPAGPSLPLDMVTGSFIRRVNGIPSLFQGRFPRGVGSVAIRYADGTITRLRPTEGYLLYEVPAAHVAPGRQAVSITTYDRRGVALVSDEVRPPGTVGP